MNHRLDRAGLEQRPDLLCKLPGDGAYQEFMGGSGSQEASTTMAFAKLLRNLMRDKALGRRVVPIDLDSKMERPEDRKDFKHPDLLPWVTSQRARLVAAALTVLRAYHVAGRPSHGEPAMGSFEAWDAIVRGAVVWSYGTDPA